jgi:hypothetical protein
MYCRRGHSQKTPLPKKSPNLQDRPSSSRHSITLPSARSRTLPICLNPDFRHLNPLGHSIPSAILFTALLCSGPIFIIISDTEGILRNKIRLVQNFNLNSKHIENNLTTKGLSIVENTYLKNFHKQLRNFVEL